MNRPYLKLVPVLALAALTIGGCATAAGDMPVAEFRAHAHTLADWAAGYFEQIETHAVLSQVKPGDIRAALPAHAPELPEPFTDLLADLDRLVIAQRPVRAHWTHTSSAIQASKLSPGCSVRNPCAAGSLMWIALLTWLTGSTQKYALAAGV